MTGVVSLRRVKNNILRQPLLDKDQPGCLKNIFQDNGSLAGCFIGYNVLMEYV